MTIEIIDNPDIAHISSMLEKQIDCGDRILEGRMELFSISNLIPPQNDSDYPSSQPSTSPSPSRRSSPVIGPYNQPQPIPTKKKLSSTKLLLHLIATMNHVFQDYDYSNITHKQLKPCPNSIAISEINLNICSPIERTISGFSATFWKCLTSILNYESPEVETFMYSVEDNVDCLFCRDYFFLDRSNNLILFLVVSVYNKFQFPLSNGLSDSIIASDTVVPLDDAPSVPLYVTNEGKGNSDNILPSPFTLRPLPSQSVDVDEFDPNNFDLLQPTDSIDSDQEEEASY